MSFVAELADQAKQVRRLATGRQFEEEGYNFAWTKDDESGFKDPWFFEGEYKPLTVKRYKKGETKTADPEVGYSTSDSNGNYYVTDSMEVWSLKYAETEWVGDMFNDFAGVTGKDLKPIFKKIKKIPRKLCATADWIDADLVKKGSKEHADSLNRPYGSKNTGTDLLLGNAIPHLAEWKGSAAATFATGFEENGEKWREIALHNYYLATTVRGGVESMLGIVAATQQDILTIADVAKKALVGVGHGEVDLGKAATGLTIVGAVVGLFLAPEITIPMAVAAGFSVTGSVMSLVDSAEPKVVTDKTKQIKITGGTVSEVLDSVWETVIDLAKAMDDKVSEIEESLGQANDAIVDNQEKFKVIYRDGAAEFPDNPKGDLDSPDLLGDPTGTALVPEKLLAASVQFPLAAEPIFEVNKALVDTAGDEEGHTFGSANLPSPALAMEAWGMLRDLLQDFTAHNGEKIRNAGVVIGKFADEAGALDVATAEEMENIEGLSELEAEESGNEPTSMTDTPEETNPGSPTSEHPM